MKRQIQIALIFIVLGGLLTTAAFFMAFYTAEVRTFGTVTAEGRVDTAFRIAPPNEQGNEGLTYERPWFAQKIYYFHAPVAWSSFVIFTIAAFFGAMFLVKKEKKYDTHSRLAAETALVFTTATMITGVLWTRASWGVWWDWEPRITTYFILLILMVAYFVLRNSIADDERRATYAAVFAIIAWIDVPISWMITRLIPSNHPVVLKSGMDITNLIPFLIAMLGMMGVGYAIYTLRAAEEDSAERLDILKEKLEA